MSHIENYLECKTSCVEGDFLVITQTGPEKQRREKHDIKGGQHVSKLHLHQSGCNGCSDEEVMARFPAPHVNDINFKRERGGSGYV